MNSFLFFLFLDSNYDKIYLDNTKEVHNDSEV